MMKKPLILAGILLLGLVLMGCMGPQYQPCCIYANATNETNPICDGGLDPETGYPLVWELTPNGCDEEAWACEVFVEDSEGNQVFEGGNPVKAMVPICPRLEEVQCNTTCAGVFCGSFEFDPRPLPPAVSASSVYPPAEETDDEGSTIPPSATGLWHAECSVQNITPLFLRHIENSNSITLNTLRFGIGNSFQDFEDAQYYFPLTDRACLLNPMGEVDRYITYAIPNTIAGGDDLCKHGGLGENCEYYPWICSFDESIHSYHYSDCAARCAIAYYGYESEIDPYNAYLTENPEGKMSGNPFAYGLDKAFLGNEYDFMDTRKKPEEGGHMETYRGRVKIFHTNGETYRDDYQYGTNLYGATFGTNGMSYNFEEEEYLLLPWFAHNAPLEEDDENFPQISRSTTDYYTENEYTNDENGDMFLPYILRWITGDDELASTVFLTVERDPHQFYPWLLSHHSIYNQQIRMGEHYLLNGSTTGGAEFECLTGQDCISGYCSTEDYSRGACLSITGEEIDCDCTEETTGTVCRGTRAYWVDAWDKPGDDYYQVETTVPLSAPISYYDDPEENLKANADEITFLPSLGTVEKLPVGGDAAAPEDIPILIISLGGSQRFFDGSSSTGGAALPSYEMTTKEDMKDLTGRGAECAFLQQIINPTSAGIVYDPDSYYDDSAVNDGDTYSVCQSTQWVAGETCRIVLETSVGGGGASVNFIPLNSNEIYQVGAADRIIQAYILNVEDDGEFWSPGFFSGTLVCDPYAEYKDCDSDETCSHATFHEQAYRLLPKTILTCLGGQRATEEDHEYLINDINKEYLSTTALCFSRSAQEEYGLSSGFAYYDKIPNYFKDSNTDFSPVYIPNNDVCAAIDRLANDEATEQKYKRAFCYQWASGGRKATSDSDVCVAESLAILVVAPHMVEGASSGNGILPEYEGRLAFGKCLVNEQGDDLEMNNYGMCEGCGYLTMAKEHIVALPDEEDPVYGIGVDNYYNAYCPDIVAHTPHPDYSISSGYSTHSSGTYDWRFFRMAPYEVDGFVSYEFGNNDWNAETPSCIYPNGADAAIDDSEAPNPYRGLPYTVPNAFYINQKLESLMKRNIQPVIFADDSGLWEEDFESGSESENNLLVLKIDGDDFDWSTTEHMKEMFDQNEERFVVFQDEMLEDDEYYYLDGSFLANTIFNEGGLILVSKIIGSQDDDYAPSTSTSCGPDDADCWRNFQSDIKNRGVSVRVLCPNCMHSFGVGYDDSGAEMFESEPRFRQIAMAFGYGNASTGQLIYDRTVNLSCDSPEITCNSNMLKMVDIISIKMVLQDGDPYCMRSGAERYDRILEEISNIGLSSLKRYGKPVVITDLIIDRSGTCWDEETAGELMVHLGSNTVTLAKSGINGIIYGDWESTTSESTGVRFDTKDSIAAYRGEFFEGVFIASRNFAGNKLQMLYNEVPVTPSCPCEECTSDDPAWLCNGHFNGDITAPLCEGYVEGSNMKWQELCVTNEVCMDESEIESSTFNCTIIHNNGTVEEVSYEGQNIVDSPGLYKDVLASVVAPKAPCFSSEGMNLSFGTLGTRSYLATPAVFSLDGDLSVRCDPTEGVGEICGYSPPVSDYEMVCNVYKEGLRWGVEHATQPSCEAASQPPACFDDTDCPVPFYCNLVGQCSNFCADDSDCPEGASCNVEEYECTMECEDATDCPEGMECEEGMCTGEPLGCITDEDCGKSPAYCQTSNCYYPCDEIIVTVVNAINPETMESTEHEVYYYGDSICTQYFHLPSYICTDGFCVVPPAAPE